MESSKQLICLVVILKVISSQDLDEVALRALLTKLSSPQCKQVPPEEPSQCCTMPDLFDMETNAGCKGADDEAVRRPSSIGSPECAERTCIFRNNDLLFDNDEIDKDSVKQYLDEWVAKRREYMPGVNAVKDVCLGNKPLFGPKEMCEADKLLMCIKFNLFKNCPNWLETENCSATRAFLEACMPYYD